MKTPQIRPLSYFQLIWLQSRVNGAVVPDPPRRQRIWPHGWLEQRLEQLKAARAKAEGEK